MRKTIELNKSHIKLPTSISSASFDYVARYQLIAEIIHQYYKGKKANNILDVGGLGTFLPKIINIPLTILDDEANNKSSTQKKGDGARMKIEDNSYEVVITSDTLEHIPKKDRDNFVHELVRVSSDLIVLCAPFADNGAAKEEAKLQEYYQEFAGESHRWLKEHVYYGLPRIEQVKRMFEDAGVEPVVFGQSSLSLWRELMGINLLANDMERLEVHKKCEAINRFYNQEVLFNDFAPDGYRMFFVASKKHDLNIQIPKGHLASDVLLKLLSLTNDFYSTALIEGESVPKIKQKIEKLHDRSITLANQVTDLTTRFEHVLHSRSWKYTAPMRRAEKIIKKAKSQELHG